MTFAFVVSLVYFNVYTIDRWKNVLGAFLDTLKSKTHAKRGF